MAPIRTLPTFATFGDMLHYLRRRAQLTQRELAIAVGYSESMISRLEHGERPPDLATIQALFVPALRLENSSEVVDALTRLAQAARDAKTAARQQHSPASWAASLRVQLRIPVRLTSFVGRKDDVLAVAKLLAKVRLVTLTGPGGCGKTSLAVETCRWLADASPSAERSSGTIDVPEFDDICLLELFPLHDASLLAQSVLVALGLEANPQQTALHTLLNAISDRHVLLMLDNCEHLVDSAAAFVQTLLKACPNAYVLVTSRERLNLAAETVYTVAPLAYPDPQMPPAFADLRAFPAIQLFVERSQAVAPSFALTPENAGCVAQICTLLDGIPLALELGAAAMATFSVEDIAERLDAHLLLASPGYRADDPRHASIGDTVAWSYNLLLPAEQHLLTQLAVFVGGWTIDAMQQLGDNEQDCVGVMQQLVRKSLVRVDYAHPPSGSTRYHLLRAVREYGAERLEASSEAEYLRRRHFAYFAQLGVTLGDEVLGAQHNAAVAGLDADHANIRAALAFGRGKADLYEAYVRLAAALTYYWRYRGYTGESAIWLDTAMVDGSGLSLAAQALAHAAVIYEVSVEHFWFDKKPDDSAQFLRVLAEADALIELCLEQGEQHAAALLMLTVARVRTHRHIEAGADEQVRRAWHVLEQLGDVRSAAAARTLLIRILLAQGKYEAAEQVHSDTIAFLERNQLYWRLVESHLLHATIAQLQHDRAGVMFDLTRVTEIGEQAGCVQALHEAYWRLEFLDRAATDKMAQEFLQRQRQHGPSLMLAIAIHQLGRICVNAGEYEQAQRYFDEVLQLWPQLGISAREGFGRHMTLIDRGELAWFQGDAELAIACFDESIRLYLASPYPIYGMCSLLYRGHVKCATNDLHGALEDLRSSLRYALACRLDWLNIIVISLVGIGEVARRRGDVVTAAKLFAAAAVPKTVMQPHEDYCQPGVIAAQMAEAEQAAARQREDYCQPHELVHYNRVMADVPLYRQDPVFETAWQEGEKLTLDEAAQLALEWHVTRHG